MQQHHPVPPADSKFEQDHVTTSTDNLWHFDNPGSTLPSLNARKIEAAD